MKIDNLMKFICILIFLFVSCSKQIKKSDLIGTWKSNNDQFLILRSDYSFEKKDPNLKFKIQKGRWKITDINDQNVLKLIIEKESQTLYLEKSFFNNYITIIKWIGDPDDFIRDEYVKIK